jgi:hypothetical protein
MVWSGDNVTVFIAKRGATPLVPRLFLWVVV